MKGAIAEPGSYWGAVAAGRRAQLAEGAEADRIAVLLEKFDELAPRHQRWLGRCFGHGVSLSINVEKTYSMSGKLG
jgi:hypothetical protein